MISGLYIVIPAKNEQKNIYKVIKKFKKYGKIIVINDNSNDLTKKISERSAFKVINNKRTIGYDFSIRKGINAVLKFKNSKYILTVDADNEHPILNFKKIIKYMQIYDLIIFNRKKLSRISEYIVDYFSRKLFSIKDPLSGMKLYKTTIIKKKKKNIVNYNDYVGMFFFKLYDTERIFNFEINTNKSNKASSFGQGLLANIKILKAFIKSI